jgi:hypothetical protein
MKTTARVEVNLDVKAMEAMGKTIISWQPTRGDNASLKKCYTQDRKDLRKVLSLYKKGKWKEAGEFASHLDTLVRDMIPDSIWKSIQRED